MGRYVKTVAVPRTSGIASLRNGDTLILRVSHTIRRGELADDPSVGELVIDYDWIAARSILAGAPKTRPQRSHPDRAQKWCTRKFIKHL